ncbi:hypothetical protein [Solidesulfovibrio magneticus]|uniref:Hypothetical membrane protein n=1 Tax=Solidesulfovibrio magneticus (strain ATCC 700980 / DSM 13731 / RS-1) TaxID=573370 RepID=C4XK30_SOLM1|nr:hypothetical protein [Solidesulfovibrio magneticus]BAH74385.1 hypothetical membrane protein [Solidesulfovibrio magneticus RS-1]
MLEIAIWIGLNVVPFVFAVIVSLVVAGYVLEKLDLEKFESNLLYFFVFFLLIALKDVIAGGDASNIFGKFFSVWSAILVFSLFYMFLSFRNKMQKALNSLNERQKSIEESMPWKVGADAEGLNVVRSSKYTVDFIVKWPKLILSQFPEGHEAHALGVVEYIVKEYCSNGSLLDTDEQVWGKNFSFDVFHDHVSNMYQCWSYFHKSFVKDMRVVGQIFGCQGYGRSSLNGSSEFNNIFVLEKSFSSIEMGFDRGFFNIECRPVVNFPIGDFINLVCGVYELYGDAMLAIKKFPDKFESELLRNGFIYDLSVYEDYGCGRAFDDKECVVERECLNDMQEKMGVSVYRQKLLSHIFSNEYLTIQIRAQCS